MKFSPQKYAIEDHPMKPFIDPDEIWQFLKKSKSSKTRVQEVIAKSLDKQRLSLAEKAVLVNAKEPDLIEQIKEGTLKHI